MMMNHLGIDLGVGHPGGGNLGVYSASGASGREYQHQVTDNNNNRGRDDGDDSMGGEESSGLEDDDDEEEEEEDEDDDDSGVEEDVKPSSHRQGGLDVSGSGGYDGGIPRSFQQLQGQGHGQGQGQGSRSKRARSSTKETSPAVGNGNNGHGQGQGRAGSTTKGKGKARASSSSKRSTFDFDTGEDESELEFITGGTGGAASGSKKMSTAGGAGSSKGATKKKQTGNGEKKKKAGRACAACQKAHLTCDDVRPCARCVKKGCPDQCHDGARKKAKYLQEIPDELLERRPPSLAHGVDISMSPAVVTDSLDGQTDSPENLQPLLSQPIDDTSLNSNPTNFSFDSMNYFDNNAFSSTEFGSEAANLEYAILSSMLNGNGFNLDTTSYQNGTDPRLTLTGSGSAMLNDGMNNLGGVGVGSGSNTSSLFDQTLFGGRRPGSSATSPIGFGSGVMSPPRLQDTAADLFSSHPSTSSVNNNSLNALTNSNNNNSNNNNNPHSHSLGPLSPIKDIPSLRADDISPTSTIPAYDRTQNRLQDSNTLPPQQQQQQPTFQQNTQNDFDGSGSGRTAQSVKVMTAEEAYRTVTKPYPYAQSYHYLVRHLKNSDRFEKNDILRIIRALATFRPSLIALQMPLTEEDETFVERTFQRTLVELNKLISFSGTPTVVWRRTGEVCLVGTEFCLLTGWSREELLGKKYIFELFDTASVVEYYESFAKHAFESTSSSVMTQCVVLGPSGRPVPCAFCFSVRRDLFSCPFLIIGSFLPVLV